MQTIQTKYTDLCNKSSDINEHLPTIYRYAKECTSIFETGVRGCISSWALVHGLLENPSTSGKRYMLLNDIDECNITEFLKSTNDLDVDIEYQWMNNLNLQMNRTIDMTFIDTWHVYGQLKRELAKFAPITNKYIIMHDTTVDEIYGETIRMQFNARQQSLDSGIPLDEINCGLGKAIDEFLQQNSNWVLKEKFTNNHGLTILERIQEISGKGSETV
jgi:hypothetical protein